MGHGWGSAADSTEAQAHAALDAMGVRKHPDVAQRVLWLQAANREAAKVADGAPEARTGVPRC